MSDLSNPTSRVLDIIKLLATHPTEDFSLADIAHHTGMSKASAYRILLTLADADYLARNAKRKTYSIGMGLVAVGQAALERYRGLDVARAEMTRLTAELSLQCSATALIGGDLLVLARVGMPQSHEGLNRVGERRPMIPPMGMCHVAWGGESVVQPYLTFAQQYLQPDVYAWLLDALALIRGRGYALAANDSTWRKLRQATVIPAGRSRDVAHWSMIHELVGKLTRDEIQLADPGAADIRPFAQIVAPVFSPDAAVAFQLVLSGLPSTLTPRKLERYVEKLLATAASVTNQMNGCVPALRAEQVG
jgi:DNA-binding IclR family transcriptional regulator